MSYYEATEIVCKYCQSNDIVKYGKYDDEQYFWCNSCKRKFTGKDTLPKMKTSIPEIASALNGYYGGEPIDAIQNRLRQDFHDEQSEPSIYKWIVRFTKEAIRKTKNFTPKVGDVWIADETGINVGGRNMWFWDIIDTKTRYLLASHLSTARTTKDAQILIEKAIERAGKAPRIIITDKLQAYVDGIHLASLGMSEHIQSKPFTSLNSTSMIERFHGILKQRTHAIHHFKNIDTARLLTEGWLIHYNFFKDNEVFNNQSPVKHMGIDSPIASWESVVRGFDRANEVKSEPYNPEPKTISLTHYGKSKALDRAREVKYRATKLRTRRLVPGQPRLKSTPSIVTMARPKKR
jgi:putative transposase